MKEFQIVELGANGRAICDGYEVRGYDIRGNRILENVPNLKLFQEIAYIQEPAMFEGSSFEEVHSEYRSSLEIPNN